MILEPHQKRKSNEVLAAFKSGVREVVLAMCTGSGKTPTSLAVIKRMNVRTLVLAHATRVLLRNYKEQLKRHMPGLATTVDVSIPQRRRRIKGRYDLVVVDEAHQFYEQKMVQGLIRRVKPKHILLLTGTPAIFVARGAHVIAYSLEEWIAEAQSDRKVRAPWRPYMISATSGYNIKKSDYVEGHERSG